eukprot:scaffold760_cov178-Ochromonas_danica.AAC.1
MTTTTTTTTSSSTTSASQSSTGRKWLREASMRRLSHLVRNKTEIFDSAQKLKLSLTSFDHLEESGLHPFEVHQLHDWVQGRISGRQCMLALLDHTHCHRMPSSTESSQANQLDHEGLDLLNIIRFMLALPQSFLCDSGYLYEEIFSKPPSQVIKEAVQILVRKAEEANSSSLGLQQINLALKQIKLDALCRGHGQDPASDEEDEDDMRESDTPTPRTSSKSKPSSSTSPPSEVSSEERVLAANILIELIRIHIIRSCSQSPSIENNGIDRNNKTKPQEELNHAGIMHLLACSLPSLQSNLLKLSPEELEAQNDLLKPYLRYLHTIKTQVSTYLQRILHNKAYLILGISTDADEETVKKKYRVLAVKFHPDKPGGSKEAFQALQAAYQEVLLRCKEREVEERVLRKMAEDDLKMYHDIMRTRGGKKKPKKASKSGEENNDEGIFPKASKSSEARNPAKEENEMDVDEEEKRPETGNSSAAHQKAPQPNDKPTLPQSNEGLDTAEEDFLLDDDSSEGDETRSNRKKSLSAGQAELEETIAKETGRLRSSIYLEIPIFLPNHMNDINHGEEIFQYIQDLFTLINIRASNVTGWLQKVMKGQKRLVKARASSPPYKAVAKIFEELDGLLSKTVDDKTPSSEVVESIEFLAEVTQRIATLSLSFASDCGPHVIQAVHLLGGSDTECYTRPIENAMSQSLAALRTVITLVTSSNHLQKASQRLHEHIRVNTSLFQLTHGTGIDVSVIGEQPRRYPAPFLWQIDKEGAYGDLYQLLVDLVEQSMSHLINSLTNSVDAVLEMVTTVTNMRNNMQKVVQMAKQSYILTVRKQVEEELTATPLGDQSHDDGDDMSEDDCRSPKNDKSDKPPSHRDVPNSPPLSSLDEMKEKIKSLQNQLYLQQVTTLHHQNNELWSLQRTIYQEMAHLPVFPASAPSSGANGTPTFGDYIENTLGLNTESVYNFLAEVLDSDLTALRNELTAYISFNCQSCETNWETVVKEIQSIVNKQYGWLELQSLNRDFDYGQALHFLKCVVIEVVYHIHCYWCKIPAPVGGDCKAIIPFFPTYLSPVKVALPGDYRGKLLLLCSVLDSHEVVLPAMLEVEWKAKVKEMVEDLKDRFLQTIAQDQRTGEGKTESVSLSLAFTACK